MIKAQRSMREKSVQLGEAQAKLAQVENVIEICFNYLN
jgi:hypothetical protein